MSRKKLRFPMFFKFLVGCLTLAALLIIGGTFVVKNEVRFKNRGNYLAQAFRRLHGYVDKVGRGMTGTTELLAADDEIREALAKLPAEKSEPKVEPPPKRDKVEPKTDGKADAKAEPAAEPRPEPPTRESRTPMGVAASKARAAYAALSGKNGIQPDLFAVFTVGNKMVWTPPGSPIAERDLVDLAAVEKARSGSVFPHRIQVVNNVPYQVSAVPIRALTSDTILGGMLIGVKLQRYYDEWSEQTDDRPELRMRPTLVSGANVLASAWPLDLRSELARAIQPEKWVKITVGEDTRDTMNMKDSGDHDVFAEDLEGYKNGDAGIVGKEIMTRSRTQIIDPSQTVPWLEIVVAIALSVLVAMVMAFLITRPIKQFVRQSRELLAGDTDLTQRIEVKSRDETAALAANINQVFERLHGLATNVQSAAFQVGASSAEISAASRQMLTGIKEGTLKIESSTTAVTELSASIQQVAGNAAQATTFAEQSSTAVNDAVRRMEQIRTAVDDSAERMRELGESSKRIGNIVEVIRQISEQTSMLALNASIEAAHAGEQGRGFAVVADEVSSLARRVGQSAKDIEALIQTVKEQTQAAITSMEVGTREVGNGSMLVTTTLTGLGELITVVKDTAVAVQEQAVVSDEIARNMDAVRNIAAEVLTGSEESVVQAERLHELAFDLEESIGGFNLDGGNGNTRPAPPRADGKAVPAPRQLPAARPRTAPKKPTAPDAN
jgi:methyl-accepting chemotaxis protein